MSLGDALNCGERKKLQGNYHQLSLEVRVGEIRKALLTMGSQRRIIKSLGQKQFLEKHKENLKRRNDFF